MLTPHPPGNSRLIDVERDGGLGLSFEVVNQPVKKRVHGISPYGYPPNHRYGYSPLQAYGRSPNNSGMELKDRLKQARKHRKMSQIRLSEATGLDQTTISNLETGKVLSTSKLVQIAHALRVDARWLATGAGQMEGGSQEPRARYSASNDELEFHDTEVVEGDAPLMADEVELPCFYEVEFSAGDGSTQVVENHGQTMRFHLSKLAKRGVSPDNAACATASGSSMEPTIADGSPIAIDKGTKHIIDGKIYALDHGGMLRIKRLYKMPLGRVRLVSDNSDEYPEEVYSLMGPDAPRVIGRVFWWEVFD
ncbi:MAG: XRE family transcriptional regulator [Pseudomonadota bacterium]